MSLEVAIAPNTEILAAEAEMVRHQQADCPVEHFFLPGLYVRKIFMPAGTLVASKVHKTTHPFTVLQGRASVRNGEEWEVLTAGHLGITRPGTHRLLYIYEDTVWVTFHPNPDNITDLVKLEELIIEPHTIPELPCHGSLPPSQ